MHPTELPSYASMVIGLVILADIIAAWIVLMTMMKNKGNLYDQGPPWMIVLSAVSLFLCWKNAFVSVEISFWAAVGFGILGLWGAWTDYIHLVRHFEMVQKEKKGPR
jgi:hypothetical protein